MDYGDAFPERIDAVLRGAKVVLVVIGAAWVDTLNARTKTAEIDYVRREVEISLQRIRTGEVLVLPIRVDLASSPCIDEFLPALRSTVEPLLQIHSPVFRSDDDWAEPYIRLLRKIIRRFPELVNGSYTQQLDQVVSGLKRWISHTLDNPEIARSRLHKPIAIVSSVRRRYVVVAIERAVANANVRTIIVAGEEGAGKTVAVGQWLRSALDTLDYAVLYTSAQESHRWSNDPVEFLRSGLRQRESNPDGLDARQRSRENSRLIHKRPWLVIIDGINEEGSARQWGELIAAYAAASETLDVRTIVTTRTEHLERQLHSYVQGKSCERISVPDFDNHELSQLLRRHNLTLAEIPLNILPLLRRPRYFQRALTHRDELAGLRNLDFPTLVFLDWRSRQEDRAGSPLRSEDFERLLRHYAETARDHSSFPVSRTRLRDSFGDADDGDFSRKIEEFLQQRVIRGNASGRLDVDARLLPIGLGLLLLDVLRESKKQRRDALRELAAQWLGDEQDDINAEICEASIAAALWNGRPPEPILLVLLQRWLTCQNSRNAPIRGLRRIYARAPEEVLATIEWAFDEGRAQRLLPDAVDLLIDLYQTDNLPLGPLDVAIDRWLGRHAPFRLSPGVQGESTVWAREAAAIDAGVVAVTFEAAQCRTLALAVLSQLPQRLTPARLRRTVLSVAVGTAHDAISRLCCLIHVAHDDYLPVLEALNRDCSHVPELCTHVRNVARHVWPVASIRSWHTSAEAESSRATYHDICDRLLDAASIPAPADFAWFSDREERLYPEQHDSEYQALDFAFALHRPEIFHELIGRAVAFSLDDPTNERGRIAKDVARFAPLLDPQQALAVRNEAHTRRKRDLKNMPTSNEATAMLSIAGDWHRPSIVRAAALCARLAKYSVSEDEIIAAAIDAHGADMLARRACRATHPDRARSYFFALVRGTAVSKRERARTRRWLSKVDLVAFTIEKRDTAIMLAMLEGFHDAAAYLVSPDWTHRDHGDHTLNSGRALALSGRLSLAEALHRLSPLDLPQWTLHSRASERERAIVSRVLATTLGLEAGEAEHDATANSSTSRDAEATSIVSTEVGRLLQGEQRHHRSANRRISLSSGEWPAHELRACFPELTKRWRELDVVGDTVARGFLHAAADAASWYRDDDAVELIRTLWKAENDSANTRGEGHARRIVAFAFRLADTSESRTLWEDMARELRTDDEILRFVACTIVGNGEVWLRERIAIGLASPLPGREVEAAVMAGVAGFTNVLKIVKSRIDEAHGWRRDGFVFALDLSKRLVNARIWYRRFRETPDWMTAFGAFRAYLKLVDARLDILGEAHAEKLDIDYAPERTRYLRTWQGDIKEAINKRKKEFAETLYGCRLPTPHLGRWDHMRKLM